MKFMVFEKKQTKHSEHNGMAMELANRSATHEFSRHIFVSRRLKQKYENQW